MRLILRMLVLLAACAGPRSASAQPPSISPERITDEFPNQEQAESLVKELAPIVEKCTGRTFRRLPPVRLVSLMDMAELVADDITYVSGLRGQDLEAKLADDLDKAIDLYGESLRIASRLVGKYSLKHKRIAIAPDALALVLDQTAHTADDRAALLRVTCAHELAHALHDQQVDYGKIVADLPNDREVGYAYGALTEAFAAFTHELVAEELQLPPAVRTQFAAVFAAHVPPEFDRESCAALLASYRVTDGMEKIWRTLEHPPANLAEELRRQTAKPPAAPGDRYAAALDAIQAHWGIACDNLVRVDGAAEKAMQTFRVLGPERTQQIQAAVAHAYSLVCAGRTGNGEKHACAVTIYALTSQDQARVLLDAYPEVSRQMAELLGIGGNSRLQRSWTLSLAGDRTVKVTTTELRLDGAVALTQTLAWCPVGDAVIQLLAINEPMPDPKLVEIFSAGAAALAN